MKRIAIFASGSGSNAENIIKYFAGNEGVEVCLILSNHPDAFVLERALKQYNVSIVILAGFLLKIPGYLIQYFPNAIINIHPALLPKYGGKGMYGMNVHRSVVENQETESGITIHYVNENYDEGAIIFQASCAIASTDSPELVQAKVQELEALHFPKVIESTIQ